MGCWRWGMLAQGPELATSSWEAQRKSGHSTGRPNRLLLPLPPPPAARHPTWPGQVGSVGPHQLPPSAGWQRLVLLGEMICLFQEIKSPTMSPFRFHKHMKTRSILNVLCKPQLQINILFCPRAPRQHGKQHLTTSLRAGPHSPAEGSLSPAEP